MWFPLFSCQPRNSSHAITATLKVLIKFYFSVTDDDFSIRDSFLIVMMLNAHKMLWLTPWNEEVDTSLQRSVTFYSHSSVINQQGRVALVGFSFSKASLYFCCILVCQCWWNTAHRNLTLPYWTIVRRTSKHFFLNKQNISLCNINVSSWHPTFITFMEHMVRVWLLLFLLRVRWESWYHCHVGTDRKWEKMSDSQVPAPFDVIF